jgi:hypothetical protein
MIITLFRNCTRRTGNQDSAVSDDSTSPTLVRHQIVLIIANRLGGIDGLDIWARSILICVNCAVAVEGGHCQGALAGCEACYKSGNQGRIAG